MSLQLGDTAGLGDLPGRGTTRREWLPLPTLNSVMDSLWMNPHKGAFSPQSLACGGKVAAMHMRGDTEPELGHQRL